MFPQEDDEVAVRFRRVKRDAAILDGTVPNGLMQVLPNPASTFLDLNLDPSLGLGEITITDLTGRVVMMRNDVSGFLRLDVQHYPLGSYLINFRGASGTSTVRFMRS